MDVQKAIVATKGDPFAESNAVNAKWLEHGFSPTDAADVVIRQTGTYGRDVRRALQKGWIQSEGQND